jgi:hypothetical protein
MSSLEVKLFNNSADWTCKISCSWFHSSVVKYIWMLEPLGCKCTDISIHVLPRTSCCLDNHLLFSPFERGLFPLDLKFYSYSNSHSTRLYTNFKFTSLEW